MINSSHASGKDDMGASLAGLLLSAIHGSMVPRHVPLFIHNQWLKGWLASTLFNGDLLISAGQEPCGWV